MACRAVQLDVSSEDTACVTSLPQSVSSGQISMWPKQLTWLVSEGSRGLRALPRRRELLCRAGSGCLHGLWPQGGWPALRQHVSSELHGRNNPNKHTSDLNPPSRAFILQSAPQVQARCTRERGVR